VLKNADHPHIIRLHEIYEDPRNISFVTELCSGGELYDAIIAMGSYTEAKT